MTDSNDKYDVNVLQQYGRLVLGKGINKHTHAEFSVYVSETNKKIGKIFRRHHYRHWEADEELMKSCELKEDSYYGDSIFSLMDEVRRSYDYDKPDADTHFDFNLRLLWSKKGNLYDTLAFVYPKSDKIIKVFVSDYTAWIEHDDVHKSYFPKKDFHYLKSLINKYDDDQPEIKAE